MPKGARHTLIWSAERRVYELYEQGRKDHPLAAADDEPWFEWLAAHASFAFQGQHGHLSLLKEIRQRSSTGYWYAYQRQGKRTLKHYAGRGTDLTTARLEQIAEALTSEAGRPTLLATKVAPEGVPPPGPPARTPPTPTGHAPLAEGGEPAEAGLVAARPVGAVSTAGPLLLPKLNLPRLHAALIAREHLLARLDAGLGRKLTLLSAPAGFGKTTLVSQWVADRSARQHLPAVAWVSLDAGDNDPVRFWRYVLTACQIFQAEISLPALARLQAAQQSLFEPSPLEAALTLFLNALSHLPQRGLLVLEDYHLITSPQIHETLALLLDHLPASLHVLLLTRADPPLPLARLRASGELNELRAADLRFSAEEAQAFLQQALPFPLSPAIMSHLEDRMEGWVTGLHLVSLALQGRMTQPEIEQYLASFSGSQRHLLEYFVSEVLEAQPEPLQVFLLQTSVLSRLTGPLCDAVSGRGDSARLLAALEGMGFFLLPLDGSGQWYRYHPLFAEAMQHEARRHLGADALRACYDRASAWYEEQGLLSEAIEAALRAEAFVRAAVLIEQLIGPQEFYEWNEPYTVRRWLEALPADALGQHPKLCLHFALVQFSLDFQAYRLAPVSLARLEQPLCLAEQAFQAQGNRSGVGEVGAFRSVMTRIQGDLALATRQARQALELLSAEEPQWRGTCFGTIGAADLLEGKLQAARQAFLQARTLFHAARNGYAARATLWMLGDVARLQGELRQASALYHEVLATAEEDLPDRARALLGLAWLSYEQNELDAAEHAAREAFELGSHLADETLQVQSSLVLARVQHARGETQRARQRLATLLSRIHPQQPPLLRREILACQARLDLAAGDLAAVERWSAESVLDRETLPRPQQEQEDLVVARLLIAQGNADAALRLLEPWRDEANQQGRASSALEMLLLMALAHAAQQRQPQGAHLLEEALLAAHAEGYQRLFLDEGEELSGLLRMVLSGACEEPLRSYIRRLVLAFAGPHAPSTEPARDIGLLSPQEQRVLRLLAAGRSKPEIAEEFVVSVNTVKTQVRRIYGKLRATRRKEALAEARRLNLL